ncbi:MAG: cell division protein CpoB [Gemmatimonadaceae bacterium]
MTHSYFRLAPAVALAVGACVATKDDVRILQNDLRVMRTEQALADSLRRARLDEILIHVVRTQDSVRVVSTRVARMQGDLRGDLYGIGQQLIQVQELTGQSQRRLQELRASLDARGPETVPSPASPSVPQVRNSPAPPLPPAGASPPSEPSTAPAPGPNQLFQLSLEQLRRGSSGAARLGFQDLLRQYPTADIAGDAQFYIAESYAVEGNSAGADSAYAQVVSRFPHSSRAPTALYKRAVAQQGAGRGQAARVAFEQVIRQYPRSDEAVLARERLRALQ